MNRRSLIVLIVMTLGLFAMNYWLDTRRLANRQEETQKEFEAQQRVEQKKQQVRAKTIQIDQVPLAKLYESNEKKTVLSWAFDQQDSFLTIAWGNKMPNKVFIESAKGKVSEGTLANPNVSKGEVAIYSLKETPSVRTESLSLVGSSELQLIQLSNQPRAIFGEYENRQIYFPSDLPTTSMLALVYRNGQLIPVGYFDYEEKKLITLGEQENILSYLNFVSSSSQEIDTDLYVLENEYQQIVISTIGGCIVEVNLPFQSASHPKSVVKKVRFDREIKKDAPANAFFPLKPAKKALPNGNITQLEPVSGGYYPLLRRGIIGNTRETTIFPSNQYASLAILDENNTLSNLRYRVVQFSSNSITLEASQPQRKITKVISLPQNPSNTPYLMDVSIQVQGDSRDLWLATGVPEVELTSGTSMSILKARTIQEKKNSVDKIKLPKTSAVKDGLQIDWICNSNSFFGFILNPIESRADQYKVANVPGEANPTRISVIDQKYNLYPISKYPGYLALLPIKQSTEKQDFRFFAGPFDQNILATNDAALKNPVTGETPDFQSCRSFHGFLSFISEPFAKVLLVLMNFFHKITHSWGFSIILLTIVVRILLYPLNAWSIKSTTKMQEVAPKAQAIREKYKKDPQKANIEVMNLYRKEGGNPMSGCLPMIIQMPFLIGMFDLLKSTFPLRGATFIPGWINDLSAPDVLFSWNYPIPFIGTDFHLLPFILGGITLYQQIYATKVQKKRGTKLSDEQKQMQNAGKFTTVIITVLFYHFPSGLNIYWAFSTLLQILQQKFTHSRMYAKSK